MRENRVKSIWDKGGVVIAGGVSLGSIYAAEVMAHQGFDCLFVDMQHAPQDYLQVFAMLQAISATDTVPIVRVPWNNPADIMRALDGGAYGIVCPMVNTKADCEAFVGACLYAPRGYRSWGPIRGTIYGGPDYFQKANDTILPIAMIETREAVENIEEILTVPGLGGVYIGPTDLSICYGMTPSLDFSKPDLLPHIDRVLTAAKAKGVPAGIWCPSLADAEIMIDHGARLVWAGSDGAFVREQGPPSVKRLRSYLAR